MSPDIRVLCRGSRPLDTEFVKVDEWWRNAQSNQAPLKRLAKVISRLRMPFMQQRRTAVTFSTGNTMQSMVAGR
ncbi:hypothetical protein O9993_03520 [Vibrio lentus]|nr:hypothetical protein [Vibrio lentus]